MFTILHGVSIKSTLFPSLNTVAMQQPTALVTTIKLVVTKHFMTSPLRHDYY